MTYMGYDEDSLPKSMTAARCDRELSKHQFTIAEIRAIGDDPWATKLVLEYDKGAVDPYTLGTFLGY